MSMTLSGNGTITGLVSGGLPDGTVLPADLSTGGPSWDSSGNISFNSGYGSVATAYGCRAWVSFNGTAGTVAIRGSGNVSSITDNGTGDYYVNFTTAMPDAGYTTVVNACDTPTFNRMSGPEPIPTTTRVRVSSSIVSLTQYDSYMNVAVFR